MSSLRFCRCLATAVALGATAFGSAYAADPLVGVDVDPVPVKVTFARTGLATFASFVASVGNGSGHTLNHVRFEAMPTVFRDGLPGGSTGLVVADFDASASSTGCTVSAGKVTCSLGQMTSGQSRSLVLVFRVPAAPTTAFSCDNVWNPALTESGWVAQSPGAMANCDRIDLAWTYFYGEGTNDNPDQSAHADFTAGLTFTALGTPTSTQVWSWVPPGGATFFTGNLGIAGTLFGNVVDRGTTTVFVPGNWNFPVVDGVVKRATQIDETEAAGTITSSLTLPGSATGSNYAEIRLRRDVTTLPAGFQLRDWVITYQHASTSALITPSLCSKSTTALPLPRPGVPCEIDGSRIEYKRNNAPTPDYIGDFEARFRAVDNGLWTIE